MIDVSFFKGGIDQQDETFANHLYRVDSPRCDALLLKIEHAVIVTTWYLVVVFLMP